MTYRLYLESNHCAHILELTENQAGLPMRILAHNTLSHDELLTMRAGITLVSSTNTNDDKQVYISEIKENGQGVEIILSDTEARKRASSEYVGSLVRVSIDEKKDLVSIRNTIENDDATILSIIITYGAFSGSVDVYCTPPSDIYDVVLDFGSEASQMLIKKRDEDSAISPIKLFHKSLKHFWNSAVKSPRVYDQQDNDEYLFRSVFYKKDGAIMNDSFEVQRPSKSDPFLSFITKRTESHGERIPNVKISYLSGVELESVDKVRLHVGIILRFIHEALEEICEKVSSSKQSSNPIAVKFSLLLPNVMPQHSVSHVLFTLSDIVNSPEYLSPYKGRINIIYVDINSCSESDASFLNWVRTGKIPMEKEKLCLTVDVGKGTTDFSIVRLLDSTHAVSEFRSGFIGAGNAISYAIFSNYISALSGGQKDQEVLLKEKVLNSEAAMLFTLDNLIENAKHNWGSGQPNNPQSISGNIANISVETVLDRIRDMGYIGDPSDIVKNMIESIADNIVQRLPKPKIDYIIFSGRAFRFKMLKDILTEKLTKVFGKGTEFFYDNSIDKTGCLFGPIMNMRLNLSSRMVGIPYAVDIQKMRDEQQLLLQRAASTGTASSTSGAKGKMKSGFKKVVDAAKNVFGNESDGMTYDDIPHSASQDEVRKIMICGKQVTLDANSRIRISGRFYETEDGYLIDMRDRPFSFYFDGKYFILRHKNGSHKLVPSVMSANHSLLFESQFPYSLKIKGINSEILKK